jgi:NAD dependent epimerase/dehydratase family enzyme
LGDMSVLLTEGRYALPKRLIELGFQFRFGNLEYAMEDLLTRKITGMSGM